MESGRRIHIERDVPDGVIDTLGWLLVVRQRGRVEGLGEPREIQPRQVVGLWIFECIYSNHGVCGRWKVDDVHDQCGGGFDDVLVGGNGSLLE